MRFAGSKRRRDRALDVRGVGHPRPRHPEPTGDVDSKTGDQIMACIQDARKQSGATLVVVTHNPDVARGADRTLHMKDGALQ